MTIKIHQNASWTESLYVDREAEQFILRRNEERRLKSLANGPSETTNQTTVTMIARKRRILQKWKTKSLVAEPGLRLDAVDLGEESPDIFFSFFKYTVCIFSHNSTIAIKWKSLK